MTRHSGYTCWLAYKGYLFRHRKALGAGLQAMPSGSSKGMPPTTFVLKPQHADVPNAQLLFKMEAQGGMALLPNNYILAHLSREAETFITRWPCLASCHTTHFSYGSMQRCVCPVCASLRRSLLLIMDPQGWLSLDEADVETILCRFKSIPAFTANLTMENFQKQTRC